MLKKLIDPLLMLLENIFYGIFGKSAHSRNISIIVDYSGLWFLDNVFYSLVKSLL